MNRVRICWDNTAQTVIRFELAPGWQAYDLRHAFRHASTLIESVDDIVHFMLVRNSSIPYAPPGMVAHLSHMHLEWHPRAGVCVHVIPHKHLHYSFRLLTLLSPEAGQFHHVATTVGSAYHLLHTRYDHPPRRTDLLVPPVVPSISAPFR